MDFYIKFNLDEIKELGNFLNKTINKRNAKFDYLVYYNLQALWQRLLVKVSTLYWKTSKIKDYKVRISPNEYESFRIVADAATKLPDFTALVVRSVIIQVDRQKISLTQLNLSL